MDSEFGLTAHQSWFMGEYYPELLNPNQRNASLILHFGGPVDLRALQGAVQEAWTGHISLRIRLRRTEAGWKAQVMEQPVPLRTLRLPPKEDFRSLIRRIAFDLDWTLNIIQGPLTRFTIVTSDSATSLIMTLHHMVADRFSRGILSRFILASYKRRVSGDVQAPRQGPSLALCAELLAAFTNGDLVAYELPAWSALKSRGLGIGWQASESGPLLAQIRPVHSVEVKISAEVVRSARAQAGILGEPFSTAILAAVGSAVSLGSNEDWIPIYAMHNGRTIRHITASPCTGNEKMVLPGAAARTIGWLSLPGLVVLPNAKLYLTRHYLKAVGHAQHAFSNSGTGYTLLRWLGETNVVLSQLPILRGLWEVNDLTSNFYSASSREPDALALLEEIPRKGDMLHPFVNCLIISRDNDGAIRVLCTYDSTLHTSEEVEARLQATVRYMWNLAQMS